MLIPSNGAIRKFLSENKGAAWITHRKSIEWGEYAIFVQKLKTTREKYPEIDGIGPARLAPPGQILSLFIDILPQYPVLLPRGDFATLRSTYREMRLSAFILG